MEWWEVDPVVLVEKLREVKKTNTHKWRAPYMGKIRNQRPNGSNEPKGSSGATIAITIAICSVISAVLMAFFGNGGYLGGQSEIIRLKEKNTQLVSEIDNARERLDGYEFSVPLFSKLPGDVDFLARGIKIDLKHGAAFRVLGPQEDDDFHVRISQILPLDLKNDSHAISFVIDGTLRGNRFLTPPSKPIPVERGAMVGPIQRMDVEFYICIEDVDLMSINVAVARRSVFPGQPSVGKGNVSIGEEGFKFLGVPKPPPPILKSSRSTKSKSG